MKRSLLFFVSLLMTVCLFSACAQVAPTEHLHEFGEWIVTKQPTCTETGEHERFCSCGEKQTQTLSAKGHQFCDWQTIKEATCTEPGEQVRQCSCGEKQTQVISVKGHVFTEWVFIEEASCTGDGQKTHTCSICGLKEDVAIPSLGHQWVDATCTEPRHCINCRLTEGEELGHVGNPGEKCSRCGDIIDIKVVLPDLPLETRSYDDNKIRIDSIDYTIHDGLIWFEVGLTKIYQSEGIFSNNEIWFEIRYLDNKGVVLVSHFHEVRGLDVGDSTITRWNIYIDSDLHIKPGTTEITLQIRDRK